MSEMVDRVAKAIEVELNELEPHFEPSLHAERIARAAIDAMREPTEAMIYAIEYKASHFDYGDPVRAWPIMIDAALSDDGGAE